MKKILSLVGLLASVALVSLQSCGSDDAAPDVLVTSHRATGQFYKINTKTGETTAIFNVTVGANDLTDVRAFVYHPKKDAFYASQNSAIDFGNGGYFGYLYKINPKTKAATVINNNSANPTWDAINNWVVAKDDSLIAIGDFNSDGNGIVKFGTDGARSESTLQDISYCCGGGMIFDKKTGVMQVGNSNNNSDGEVIISTIDTDNPGVISANTSITTLTGFPDVLTTAWLNVKGMAKAKNGTVYCILHNNDLGKSYFATVDLTGKEITYISTLGADWDNQYNALAFIPAKYAK